MTTLREAIRRLFPAPPKPIPPGIYHFQAPPDAHAPYRLHLRIEPDGNGVLILNASTVLHLNRTATEYAYYLVQQTPPNEVAQEMAQRYQVNYTQARDDFKDLVKRIEALIASPDLDPVAYLDFDRFAPYSQQLSAPYRLDCALTYRLPAEADPSLTPTKRVERELTTAEWQAILDKAWQAGIPHVIFTGGEPTLRDDLPQLVAHAESLGMVSGLLSDGLRLADSSYMVQLLQTGLDHVMVALQPQSTPAWNALEYLLAADIFTVIHLTLSADNRAELPALLERLQGMGAETISLTTMDEALRPALEEIRQKAAQLGLSLVWDLPVPYSAFNPVAFETQEQAAPQGAGKAWLYVEPDGDVLPAQGVNRVLGNLLKDEWDKIWQAARG